MEDKKTSKTKSFKKSKSTGRRNNFRKDDGDYKRSPRVEKDVANDPKWYLKNGVLPKGVANFSFDQPTGDKIVLAPYGFNNSSGADDTAGTFHMPGIGAIYTVPCCGRAMDETDPVNVAALDIYSWVRHANSGHANYDPADLMIYLLAMDSIYTYWSWMTRLYGVCKTYSQTNRYVGDALVKACGGDPADIRKHLAEFNAYINQFAISASVLAVPATMTFFARHSWMYQNVYMDEDNPKAQFYCYAPAALHKFELDDESKGMLKAFPVCLGMSEDRKTFTGFPIFNTFDQITVMGDNLLQAALQQEDCGIMSGDIRKAYGAEKLWRFAQLDLDYSIAPIFSEEVLLQIHNSNFTGLILGVMNIDDVGKITLTGDAGKALSITQNSAIGSSSLRFFPIIGSNPANYYTRILDTWKQDVTPEEVMVATRNMLMTTHMQQNMNIGGVNVNAASLQACGSELCITMKIFTYDNGQLMVYSDFSPTATEFNRNQQIQNIVSKFNEYPLYYWFITDANGHRYVSDVVGELTNFTTLDLVNLQNLHKTALLSMFNVPSAE